MRIDILGSGECGPDCEEFLAKWAPWWKHKSRHPVALLATGEYMGRVSAKTRNMVRKAESLYEYREFSYNDQLEGIFAVNTSKPVRSGGPMTEGYSMPLRPVSVAQTCERHRSAWYGGFAADGTLVAYCNLVILNDLGVINTILASISAAMNGLIAYLATQAPVKWIHYLTIRSSPPSLAAFKLRAGFEEMLVA